METTKQEPKESFFSFITKWRSKVAQIMNRLSEEEQLTMVVKNLLHVYHKYFFAQYFPNFKALIASRTQIKDAINNGTIKNEDPSRFKMNLGSSSKTAEVPNIYKNDPYQLIAPIAPVPILHGHELYMPVSKVFEKLKAKGLLKPLDPRPIPNTLPAKFDVTKRYAYNQSPGYDTDKCFGLRHTIQDLIDNKVIILPTRPSITNNLLPNHNFGRGPRINYLMTKKESEEDLSLKKLLILSCEMM